MLRVFMTMSLFLRLNLGLLLPNYDINQMRVGAKILKIPHDLKIKTGDGYIRIDVSFALSVYISQLSRQ